MGMFEGTSKIHRRKQEKYKGLNQAYKYTQHHDGQRGKKGAGQYFTPRLLIKALVRCIKPDPRAHKQFTICDPACGTGSFLICAYEWLMEQTKGGAMDRHLAKRIKNATYFGQEMTVRRNFR